MIIDMHVHENKYSKDSFISLDDIIKKSKEIGLDGVCITDHESNDLMRDFGSHFYKDGILVIVGAEFLTFEGDILVFGMEKLPEKMVHADELTEMVAKYNGVCIPAHPFRNNNRGLGENIRKVSKHIHGVEAFNGSTFPHANLTAYSLATELNLSIFGSSDAHVIENLGKYATEFSGTIRDYNDFLSAVKEGNVCPVVKKTTGFERINIYDTFH